MDPMQLIAAARARRADAGLIANNGIACPTAEWRDYYNARDAAPRDGGRVKTTPALRALKARAVASTAA